MLYYCTVLGCTILGYVELGSTMIYSAELYALLYSTIPCHLFLDAIPCYTMLCYSGHVFSSTRCLCTSFEGTPWRPGRVLCFRFGARGFARADRLRLWQQASLCATWFKGLRPRTIGALTIRIGLCGPLKYKYNKDRIGPRICGGYWFSRSRSDPPPEITSGLRKSTKPKTQT